MKPHRSRATGRRAHGALLFTVCAAATTSAAHGQTAYFSLQGNLAAAGDKEDYTIALSRAVSNAETLRFQTFARNGGTNAAGDVIAANPSGIDSVLQFFDASTNQSRGLNDDQVAGNLDSLITWTQSLGVALNPNPMPVANYRLNQIAFNNTGTGPWAVDLVGPADAMSFSGASPTGTSTVSSLKFGTAGAGGNFAVFNNSGTDLSVTGEIVVGQSGNGTLNHSAGTITAGGNITVNTGDTYNLTGGTLNANGGVSLSVGQLLRTSGSLALAPNKVVGITNGGLLQWGGTTSDFTLDQASSGIDLSGTGSTFRQTDSNGIDSSVFVKGGAFINANIGGTIEAEYLVIENGSVLVTAATSSLNVTAGNTAAFRHVIGLGGGNTGSLTLSNSATGSFASTLATTLEMGSVGAVGTLNVNTDADLTLQSLDMSETGSGTVTLNGSGSTITQTGASTTDLGKASGPADTINIQSSGVFTTGTGALTINKTGTLNVAGGTFNANGHVTINNGKLLQTAGAFNLAAGKNLTASNGAQVSFSDTYDLKNSSTFTIQSGSSLSTSNWLDVGSVGNGTLIVEDVNSTLTAGLTSGPGQVITWGGFGGTGIVTIRGQATATLHTDLFVGWTFTLGSGTLNVLSGAQITTKNIAVGSGSAGTGQIVVENASSKITQTGASTLTIGGTGTSSGTVHVKTGGTFLTGTGLTTVTSNGTLINSGGTLTTAAVLNNGSFSSANNTNVTGGITGTGTTNVNAAQTLVTGGIRQGTLSINGNGKAKVADSSPTLPAHPAGNNASFSRVSTLTIANNGGPLGSRTYTGTLDLGNNDLIIDYSVTNPAADIEDMVRSGFNGGNWQGAGMTSSTAANALANGNYALAVADNNALTNKFGDGTGGKPQFDLQNVDDTTVLVKFTHRVDLDLDGLVTPNDAIIFATNYIQNGNGNWITGDVDYDGKHTQNDAIIFATFYNGTLPSLPEPASALGMGGLFVLMTLPRRTRTR